MKLLSLDIGDKRIGVAKTDSNSNHIFGLTVLIRKNRDLDLSEIKKLVEIHQIEKVIIGIPLTDNNRVSKQGEKIVRFANRLKNKLSIPVVLWDERYSSRDAADILINRGDSIDDSIDRVAACIILRKYIEANKGD